MKLGLNDMEPDVIRKFVMERDAVLMSMDEPTIRAFLSKYGEDITYTGVTFWAGVHKAITGSTTIPIEFRKQSKQWLDEHGFKSMDDGDL